MQFNNILHLAIFGAIGVLMVVSLALPVASSAAETVNTFTGVNDSSGYNNTLDDVFDKDVTINISYLAENNSTVDITYGDASYTITPVAGDGRHIVLFYSDVCQLFINRVEGNGIPIYCIKSTTYTGNIGIVPSVFTYNASTKEVSLTVSGTETYTDTVVKLAYVYAGDNGEYAPFKSAYAPTFSKDAKLDMAVMSGWWNNTYVTYTATTEEWANSADTKIEGLAITKDPVPTEYNAEFSMSWTDNGNGTYTRAGNLAYTYNDGNNDVSGTATKYYIIAPIEYTYTEQTTLGALFDLVPLMLVAGLVLGIVAVVVKARLS